MSIQGVVNIKKCIVLISVAITSAFLLFTGYISNAKELQHDANAAKQLEIIRNKLVSLPEMKFADSKKYYEESLKELTTLMGKYPGTEEELTARLHAGNIHIYMKNFDEAIKCFDFILNSEINNALKANTLFFKIKALIGKGDTKKAKDVVAELRLVEPLAAESFTDELGNIVKIGMDAPVFNTADINGKPVDLAKYKGNIVVLVFWATWCEPCLQEFPNVKIMYDKFKDRGVQVIGISLDDDIGDLTGFVKQEEIGWPQIYDGKRWNGAIPSLYHVQNLPKLFVLDRENKIRYIGSNTEDVSRVVTTLLSESKEVPLFR